MDSEDKSRERLIISEGENQFKPHRTSEARSLLYRLIAHLRIDADHVEDARTRGIYELAIEVLSMLARIFQNHDEKLDREKEQSEH